MEHSILYYYSVHLDSLPSSFYIVSCCFEILWGTALDFFEGFNEISGIVEAAAESNLGNGHVGCKKHIRRLLDAIMVDVIHRRLLGQRVEETAKVV